MNQLSPVFTIEQAGKKYSTPILHDQGGLLITRPWEQWRLKFKASGFQVYHKATGLHIGLKEPFDNIDAALAFVGYAVRLAPWETIDVRNAPDVAKAIPYFYDNLKAAEAWCKALVKAPGHGILDCQVCQCSLLKEKCLVWHENGQTRCRECNDLLGGKGWEEYITGTNEDGTGKVAEYRQALRVLKALGLKTRYDLLKQTFLEECSGSDWLLSDHAPKPFRFAKGVHYCPVCGVITGGAACRSHSLQGATC